MSEANDPRDSLITLDELERLIRILGMLGSGSDGEVLAAARFAQKWVTEKGTDWRTLLTPPEEPLPVLGVGPPVDVDALAAAAEADRVQAFKNGYQAGMRDAAAKITAQLKAQAAALHPAAQATPGWAGLGGGLGGLGAQNAAQGSQAAWASQAGLGGLGAQNAAQGSQAAWASQAASQAPQRGPRGGYPGGYPGGSWQAVCVELLDRSAQGIPGVFRNANEESFVGDVLKRGFRTLTPAQDTWLRDIAGRNGLSW